MKTVAVIGCGFVGGTTATFLEERDVNVIRVDPVHYPKQSIEQAIKKADGCIIAVPTPQGVRGECDDTIVVDVINKIGKKLPILLKSTVTMDKLKRYPNNVIYNPEFLRERCAMEDFINADFQIFGAENNDLQAHQWAELFQDAYAIDLKVIDVHFVNRITASMIKYVHNSWLATKVAWFHELYRNLPNSVDYNELVSILGGFKHIGDNHMQAPNHDGGLGYGGACFPKDVSALLQVMEHSILSDVHDHNRILTMMGESLGRYVEEAEVA